MHCRRSRIFCKASKYQLADVLIRYVRVLTLLNMGPRDPTLLHVLCGVCGKAAALSSKLTRPNGSSNSRRVLLIVSPSLRVGPRALAARARLQPSPRRRHFAAAPAPPPPPRSSPSRDSRPICCRPGHSPASLVACRRDASWHLHSAPPSARKARPYARHLVACDPLAQLN
jgi:hypothetical protein